MIENSQTLILSQDYELFFQRSGSIEKCLFEPCDALLRFAGERGIRITFYIDAGMIICMRRFASRDRVLRRMMDQVTKHIATLAERGHEVALHIHPHWEDTRWTDSGWNFANTRYQLGFFDSSEVDEIIATYAACLAEVSGQPMLSYRAGGFCVEPFNLLRSGLLKAGINIDSSVVSGAFLIDPDKGFDFRSAPDTGWWKFADSPSVPEADGDFVEIPITPQKLPFFFYWGRLMERLLPKVAGSQLGDGTSKSIGRLEVIRRLAGRSRVAELSIDDAKAGQLLATRNLEVQRNVWHLMGHPKLVSRPALETFDRFIEANKIKRFETVSAAASFAAAQDSPDNRRM